jgi:hypothetical protein
MGGMIHGPGLSYPLGTVPRACEGTVEKIKNKIKNTKI